MKDCWPVAFALCLLAIAIWMICKRDKPEKQNYTADDTKVKSDNVNIKP